MPFVTNDPSNYIAAAVQTAEGTDGTDFFFFKHLEGSGAEPEPEIQSEREGGDGQEVGLRYISKLTADGNVVSNARPVVAAKLWAWALGQESVVTAVSTALHDHTAVVAASQPFVTVEQRAPADIIERTNNNVITTLTEEFEAGRPLKLSAQFISGGSLSRILSASALTLVARETARPIQYPGASVVLTIGGSQTSKLTKGKIEVKRSVDDDIQTTGLNRDTVVGLAFDCDLEGTFRYEDKALYQNVYYGTGTTALTDLPTAAFNLFSARGSFSHRVCFPVFDVYSAKVGRLDPDGKTCYVDFVGGTKKGATTSVFAVTRTGDPTSYLQG